MVAKSKPKPKIKATLTRRPKPPHAKKAARRRPLIDDTMEESFARLPPDEQRILSTSGMTLRVLLGMPIVQAHVDVHAFMSSETCPESCEKCLWPFRTYENADANVLVLATYYAAMASCSMLAVATYRSQDEPAATEAADSWATEARKHFQTAIALASTHREACEALANALKPLGSCGQTNCTRCKCADKPTPKRGARVGSNSKNVN